MKKKTLTGLLALALSAMMLIEQPALALANEPGTEPAASETVETGETVESGETTPDTLPDGETAQSENTNETPSAPGTEAPDTDAETPGAPDENAPEDAQTPGTDETQAPEAADETIDGEAAPAKEDAEAAGDADAEFAASQQESWEQFGFKGMDLSQDMYNEKSGLKAVTESLQSMKAGEDYEENRIVYFAESEQQAKEIAACYGGTVAEFEYGVAVASIEADVEDAVKAAADMTADLPAVYPDIYYHYCVDWSVNDSDESLNLVEAPEENEPQALPSEGSEEPILLSENGASYEASPSDPGYAKQWHLAAINAEEAWTATKGAGVVVAVLDSGIDYTHPDLKDNIIDYASTVSGGTGKDAVGHGTHCAGIIAAAANGIGVVGVAPEAKIFSVQVGGVNGCLTSDMAQGVNLAAASGVDVISMSIGGIYYDAAFYTTIKKAISKGIVVVSSSGNEYWDQKTYPAAYDGVIAVAASNSRENLTDFSNYGSWVHVASPGKDIYSTMPTYKVAYNDERTPQNYAYMDGTSMACPLAAGVVALILSNSPSLKNANTASTVSKVRQILTGSTETYIDKYNIYEYDKDTHEVKNILGPYSRGYTYPRVDAELATFAVDAQQAVAPTITLEGATPDSKKIVDTSAGYLVINTTSQHAKVYVTFNGKKPSRNTYHATFFGSSDRVSLPSLAEYLAGREILSKKVKIQAVTVIGTKVSKVTTATYSFGVKATAVYAASESMKVAVGGSIQLSTSFSPYYTTNQKLTWVSSDATNMVKVNASGKVTCNRNAAVGTPVTITATTTDGSNKSCTFTVTPVAQKVDTVILNKTSLKMSYWADSMTMRDADGTLYCSSYKLVPSNSLTATTDQYLYKSSNTKVAYVYSDGTVYAQGKGTATITVTANDGSGKKATCKVTVVNPVLRIDSSSSTGFSPYNGGVIPIGTGCSVTMKATVNYGSKTAFGAPSNPRLKWESYTAGVTVNGSGKVTCGKNVPVGTKATIVVSAADGFGTYERYTFQVTDAVTKMFIIKNGRQRTSASTILRTRYYTADLLLGNTSYPLRYISAHKKDVPSAIFTKKVDVSNRDSVYRVNDSKAGWILLATKPGTCKITYMARDGSNKKFVYTVKVK